LTGKLQSVNIPTQNQRKIYDKYKYVPKEVMKVAEGMEEQFINHMVSEMKKSVKRTQPMNQAERFYNSKMDEEYSKIMSQTSNGLGLKEMIIEQLAPQYIRNDKLAKNVQGLRTYQKQEVDSTKGDGHE
jgi:Rod binding domain-containing protein